MIDRFILDKKSGEKLYLQIYRHYKNEIMSGKIIKNEKLPSVRGLAKGLNVSKITIESAYNQLAAEGYIENIPRKGYFAVELKEYGFKKIPKQKRVNQAKKSYINTGVDKDSFDFKLWRKLYGWVIREKKDEIFDGGDLQGELLLRQEISRFISKSRGVYCTPDQIVIGSGSQYLLGIISGLIRESTQTVIVEDPGFVHARQTFEDYGFEIEPVSVDEEGIRTDLLYETKGNLAYLSPSHQYPMGTVMPIKRRLEVLNWAREKDILIVEDDYDSIIRYETEPIPSLQGLDEGEHVVYLGSFSKLLTPSIRISYMVLTRRLIETYNQNKNRFTQTASKLEQLTLGQLMKEGHFERHLRKINKIYYKKNIMIKERLKKKFGDQITIIGGNSGLHLIIQLNTQRAKEELENIFCANDILTEKIDSGTGNVGELILLTYSGIPLDTIEAIL
ncbi:PLP-dependent aminotransferase family protein [Alkalibacter saccharofermentans]|uniref:GntR family transcriptional regulator / MocR family aminotransferase n=1 Tax=Alkalibacter saccharofermentans DSM 14828 TaxID=1120975 RepID=A0A1M4TD51_9FIRM|nr:PLP-dependent aminotransferase family protein [Alkalibacter saccharofermentans]SHE42416.1 GntR family transcriptional regulator / MocR family aminotransferase [Alkalibacter saccharofermentans DSM 14828]